ncbi:hypothetical protein CKAH01_12145 [Colletotrichum kahawae]|uniref:Uncharacterized protein n=1 Tax=Colletotrichum kahawae TaxID=34407 RepID=A0AAE0DFK6_COLKA|nr:hypothetical protein CKAH01_12145 [Colletotrichum kahawae]
MGDGEGRIPSTSHPIHPVRVHVPNPSYPVPSINHSIRPSFGRSASQTDIQTDSFFFGCTLRLLSPIILPRKRILPTPCLTLHTSPQLFSLFFVFFTLPPRSFARSYTALTEHLQPFASYLECALLPSPPSSLPPPKPSAPSSSLGLSRLDSSLRFPT